MLTNNFKNILCIDRVQDKSKENYSHYDVTTQTTQT
jgi:hypothetical protein